MTVYDPDERDAAAWVDRRNPQWLVLWGTWSREFWAFPCFAAPPGTIVHAGDHATLLDLMHEAGQ
ncbi:MAG TPA: hypothetical protein VGS19_08120 [Streptosporangiaceae bacterium]|nr:hypothetical protein [Streptosporangiaceae bacterium]